ncbi:12491_t:CDS:2, partial [Cetraspora pellucida]
NIRSPLSLLRSKRKKMTNSSKYQKWLGEFLEENDVTKFEYTAYNNIKNIEAMQGRREQTIPGTPIDFASLYKKCWNAEPKERPTINEILENLSLMSKIETIQFIINRNRESIPVLDAIPLLDATKELPPPILNATPVLVATDATKEHTPILNVFDTALDATKKPIPVLDITELNISRHSKWFEQIKDIIANYGFSAFENIKVIGKGAFGVVYSAEYHGKMFALKSLENDNVNKEVSKEFIKETII